MARRLLAWHGGCRHGMVYRLSPWRGSHVLGMAWLIGCRHRMAHRLSPRLGGCWHGMEVVAMAWRICCRHRMARRLSPWLGGLWLAVLCCAWCAVTCCGRFWHATAWLDRGVLWSALSYYGMYCRGRWCSFAIRGDKATVAWCAFCGVSWLCFVRLLTL